MGRGGAIYLSYTALVLLSTPPPAHALCAFCDLWKVSIWEAPAPAPEDGPPFSANAIRDRSVLPYEIVGVIASYIVTVILLGALLLTVGRRLRRQAQEMATKPTELVKPMRRQFDPSPISPRSARSWYSRKLRTRKSAASSLRSGHSNVGSPAMDSVVSFDPTIVEADRARRQEEMERLYAAVMAHDDRKSQQDATTVITPTEGPPGYTQKRPPRLVTDDPRLRHLQAPELSPRSPGIPKSPIRAIYPPDSPAPPMPQSPGSPIRAEYPPMPLSPPYPTNQSGELRATRRDRAASTGSRATLASDTMSSTGKKLRKSLRNITISAPLQTGGGGGDNGDDNSDGARTPLSPRFYTDPGIPPEPPTTARTTETMESRAPTTPGTARSWRYPGEREAEELDEVRDLPLAHPNRLSTYGYNYGSDAQALTDAASAPPDPTNRDGSTKSQPTATPASAPNRPLPFRQLNTHQPPPQPQPQPHQQPFPLSPLAFHHTTTQQQQHPPALFPLYPFSAGPGQTQFVSPRRDRFGGPRTGVATPYSPYMPFTPLTPVTPHLTSRAERRQRAREERGLRGVVTEEERVVGDGELWSSGY
ncbi:hypothetical protein LTR53_016021 [Teratosphaeriaceae sp. CCFEE 6253]|nr:hypothetical protein LTR53_016021 [Teratosphaeriaceae sp. CCFEE 6253]